MLNAYDILETIRMIQDECLDIRTITMGISLLDCIDSDIDSACAKVYEKITSKARDLVKTGERIEKEYGIPIIHKRISVTPIAIVSAACREKNPVKFALTLQKAADECGVNFIGGYSALVQKGFSAGDKELINSIPEALSLTSNICSSINVGSSKSGINMDAVAMMGKIIKKSAEITGLRYKRGSFRPWSGSLGHHKISRRVNQRNCRHNKENRFQDNKNGTACRLESV